MADSDPVELKSVVPHLGGDENESPESPGAVPLLKEKKSDKSFQALHAELMSVLQKLQEVHEQEIGRARRKTLTGKKSSGKKAGPKSYVEKDDAQEAQEDELATVAPETRVSVDEGSSAQKLVDGKALKESPKNSQPEDIGDPSKSAISQDKLYQMVSKKEPGRETLKKPISRVWSFVEAEVKPWYTQAKSLFGKEDDKETEADVEGGVTEAPAQPAQPAQPQLKRSSTKVLEESKSCQKSLDAFVRHPWFKAACIIVIIANVAHLGLQSDWQMRTLSNSASNGGDDVEGVHYLDYFFGTLFTMEILLRILAKGPIDFFCGNKEKWWNLLDTVIALEALVGLMIRLSYPSFRHVRVLGVFRLIRLVHPMKQVKELRKLAKTLLALFTTLRDLFSAFMMVTLFLYVYSIFLSTASVEYFGALGDVTSLEGDDLQTLQEAQKCFGSIPATMLSLWSAISGGNDWMGYAELLESMSGGSRFYYWSFILFTAFWTIGLSNVVTGLVVEAVTAAVNELRSETDVIEAFQERKTTEEEDLEKLRTLLAPNAQMDSHKEHLSLDELETHLYNEETGGKAQAFWLTKMQMTHHQVMDLWRLYKRLQPEESEDGKDVGVDLKGLLHFARKCQGHASYVDLLTLMHDQTRFEKIIQNEFKDLKQKH